MEQSFQRIIVETKTKAELIEEYRYTNVEYFPWYEDTVNEVQNILENLGFNEPKYSFSGFCCQGDGGSFTVKSISFKTIKELEEIELDMNGPCTQFREELLSHYRSIYDSLKSWYVESKEHTLDEAFQDFFENGDFEIWRHNNHYCHHRTISIRAGYVPDYVLDYFRDDDGYSPSNVIQELLNDLAQGIFELIQDLGNKIYRTLEEEYRFQTSDNSVWETIEANDYFGYSPQPKEEQDENEGVYYAT